MVQVHQICDQIQSAFRQSHKYTTLSFDKTTQAITHILYSQGFIQTYTKIPHASPGKYIPPHQLKLQLELKYRNGKPALTAFKPVSLPSRKVYASHQDLMFIASARDSGHLLKAHKLGQGNKI